MIKHILHTSFLVQDLEKSIGFYQDILGLKQDLSRPEMRFSGAWFNVDESGQQIHLLVLPNPDSSDNRPKHGGQDRHVAFAVQRLDELKQILDSHFISYTLSKSGRKALFCRDPDGNALEFIET